MIRSPEINLVAAALVKAQSEMGSANKGSSNPFFKSKYADLNSIREACLPALFANDLSVMQPTVVVEGKNYVETMVLHKSGQYLGGHTEIVYSKQNDAQNFGAGTTYARRFGLQALLCVGAEDLDGEDAVGRTSKASEKAAPAKPLEAAKPNTEANKGANGTYAAQKEEALTPPKKGFGVKQAKTEAPAAGTEDGWS